MKRFALATIALAVSALIPAVGHAYSSGIFGVARPGAGCSCHQLGPPDAPVTLVTLLVDDRPLEIFAGYEPGKSYKLTVWVIGPVVPLAGFNLEASAGKLQPRDSSTQVGPEPGVLQATHTAPKPAPFFEVTWTAPATPVQVQLFLAGNSVSGEGSQAFDFWNFADPNPMVLTPAP